MTRELLYISAVLFTHMIPHWQPSQIYLTGLPIPLMMLSVVLVTSPRKYSFQGTCHCSHVRSLVGFVQEPSFNWLQSPLFPWRHSQVTRLALQNIYCCQFGQGTLG